jgi:Zn-dependent protease
VDEYIPSQPIAAVASTAEPAPAEASPAEPTEPRRRRILLPVVLFVLTCVSTYYTGSIQPDDSTSPPSLAFDWSAGLTYMLCVMSILLAHEFGHFLQAVRYGIPASLPFFIPMPLMPLGTMGAVIGMEGSRADRKQLFDIGITGPIAGLVVAFPIAWYGIKTAVPHVGVEPGITLMDPLVFQWMISYLHPGVPVDTVFTANPYYMAGWFGMLITALNMMPISQLDGGHTAYALFGRAAHWLARGVVSAAVAYMVWNKQPQWGMMLMLIMFLGIDHPPTSDDTVKLGAARKIIGLLALTIPIFCFTLVPIRELVDTDQRHDVAPSQSAEDQSSARDRPPLHSLLKEDKDPQRSEERLK